MPNSQSTTGQERLAPVAQTPPGEVLSPLPASFYDRMEVILKNETNSGYNIIILELLLLLIITLTGKVAPRQIHKLLSEMKETSILNPTVISIFYYIKTEKAVTSAQIVDELGVREASLYRYLKILQENGAIRQVSKIRNVPSGGPKPYIYGTDQTRPEDIARCRQREKTRSTKGYQYIQEVTQLILDDYLPSGYKNNELKITDIRRLLREHLPRKHGYNIQDLGDMIALELKKHNITVWY